MIPIGAPFIAPSVPEKSSELDHYPFDDAYWLRYFAAAAMQGVSTQGKCSASYIVEMAKEFLEEIKRVEAEKK